VLRITQNNKFDDKFDKLYHLLENRDRDHRSYSFKLFMASISISVVGVLGLFLKMSGMSEMLG